MSSWMQATLKPLTLSETHTQVLGTVHGFATGCAECVQVGSSSINGPPALPVFNVIKLVPAPADPIPGCQVAPPPLPELVNGEEHYELETILDSRLL